MNRYMDMHHATLPAAVRVGSKEIGAGHPTFIIAEIGNNHNGDIVLAKEMVKAAKLAGADAVKSQKRIPENVFTRGLLSSPQINSASLGKTYGEYRKKLELKDEELAELKELAHSLGMAFFVTPFDLASAAALAAIGMDAWKVASFDVNHPELLEFIARKNQPVFLSTGMSTLAERDRAVETILKYNNQLVINHCVSIYPTPVADLNLGAVRTLIDRYHPLPVGYSGHEVGYVPTVTAVALGASAVERHFTTDKTLPGPDHGTVSLDPSEFADMARHIRIIEKAIADSKIYVHEREIPHRNKHGKSVVSKVHIPAGAVISADMLVFKSPGYGIKPTEAHKVIGRTAKVDVPDDTVITEEVLA